MDDVDAQVLQRTLWYNPHTISYQKRDYLENLECACKSAHLVLQPKYYGIMVGLYNINGRFPVDLAQPLSLQHTIYKISAQAEQNLPQPDLSASFRMLSLIAALNPSDAGTVIKSAMARIIYLFSFIVVSTASSHVLLLWEHKNFQGGNSYVLASDYKCISLLPDWRNRVSSLNTNKNCFQLFKNVNCSGDNAFVYPMSKYHNDLVQIGLNDVINSVRLCVLDEQSLDSSYQLLSKTKPEFLFWDFFFGKTSLAEQKAFRHLVAKHNHSYIPWNFIPGIRGNIPWAQQYQLVLDWLLTVISDKNFTVSDLKELRKLSYKVFDDRANRNAARRPTPVLGTEEDAITFQLEVYWKHIVEAIDNRLEEIADELEMPKRRPKPPKQTGRQLLFWLSGWNWLNSKWLTKEASMVQSLESTETIDRQYLIGGKLFLL